MADAARSRPGGLAYAWRRLNTEQRVAGVGATLLVISTFGPFSFVEAAIALTGLAVLALLRERAEGKSFHLPSGDGTVILAAGLWSALLIVVRIFDRPLGQSVLALGCCVILAAAGLRERAKRPADDIPPPARPRAAPPPEAQTVRLRDSEDATVRLENETVRLDDGPAAPPRDESATVRLPPADDREPGA